MVSDPRRIRRAVRALVIDGDHNVLLVRLQFPSWAGWVLPGGGVQEGEDDLSAIRRELEEELGLIEPDLIGPIWQRTVIFSAPVHYDAQSEDIYYVRSARFEPSPMLSWAELEAEGVTAIRWWTHEELTQCEDILAPTRLAALITDLITDGLPSTAIDVGD